MKKLKYLFLSFIIIFTSCDDFLNEIPNKSGNATIYSMDQLVALMGNSSIYNGSSSIWTESLFASDDCDISPYLYNKKIISDTSYGVSLWDRDTYSSSIMEPVSWSGCYQNMFTFNLVLEQLDKVKSSSTKDKEMVRGEALFARAYFHFFALVSFTQYNLNAPGIGYKDNTSAQSIPKRETVKYTLDRIDNDIAAAETSLTAAGRTEFELKRNFRITLPTLYAFKARVELYKGNYANALDAANKALNGYNFLEDFKTNDLYKIFTPTTTNILDDNGAVTGSLPYNEMTTIQGQGLEAFVKCPELYLPNCADLYFSNRIIPLSESLYNLFDKNNDERWKHFYNNNYVIAKSPQLSKNGLSYEDQQRLRPWEYHTYLRFVTGSGSSGKLYILGPTTAEMMLIKAECLARDGKTTDARRVLQELRRTRFTTIESANNIGGTVQDVLDERRRELTSIFRWYDLKRLNGKENANIVITKRRYSKLTDLSSPIIETRLLPNDPFYALPIPTIQLRLMGWADN